MAKVISRLEGSLVIVQAKDGTLWLARRKKRKKDSKGRILTRRSVVFIPIESILEQSTRKILTEKTKIHIQNNLYIK
jgi:hypothetical protein